MVWGARTLKEFSHPAASKNTVWGTRPCKPSTKQKHLKPGEPWGALGRERYACRYVVNICWWWEKSSSAVLQIDAVFTAVYGLVSKHSIIYTRETLEMKTSVDSALQAQNLSQRSTSNFQKSMQKTTVLSIVRCCHKGYHNSMLKATCR